MTAVELIVLAGIFLFAVGDYDCHITTDQHVSTLVWSSIMFTPQPITLRKDTVCCLTHVIVTSFWT